MKKAGIILSILLSVALSCKEEKKDAAPEIGSGTELQSSSGMADASFSSDRLDRAFEEYQQLRAALVASDGESAQKAAALLSETLGEEEDGLTPTAKSIASTKELEVQRALFSELTASLDPLFREALRDGEIYQQYCPMAFEGKGGYWISDKEEIRNPYYGDKMLTCGKVTEVIKR
ncbi:Protein of unknown function [Muriicola jejuensis]|uniref:DUF3347 domain-containing protein n=1 Tax=Muriicola jejuensis TaxID=504488 RepID=A0A6P0UG54_9FLAO|nr:DUF3347 domain-containing protein [Muriicola jejuensis]NER10869.1 DUF3347 domain-containing protein [Muriicola jejuensis]SMP15901.1 Protein of unknown function [Muriicola jejuensis]